MTILGMGPLEILVILLIAFIVLGPERMVTTARTLGKVTGELRRMAEGLPQITLDEEPRYPPKRPIVHRGGGSNPSVGGQDAAMKSDEETADEPQPESGPVAFKPSSAPSVDDDRDEPKNEDQA
jgi:Sec-independent protein translocase protein TatA